MSYIGIQGTNSQDVQWQMFLWLPPPDNLVFVSYLSWKLKNAIFSLFLWWILNLFLQMDAES